MSNYSMFILAYFIGCYVLARAGANAEVTLSSSKPKAEKNYGQGNDYTLTCAGGTGPYTWYVDSTADASTTGSTLAITGPAASTVYECESGGVRSDSLTIQGRLIKDYGITGSVNPLQGQEASFKTYVTASADAPNKPPTFQWFKPSGEAISGATDSALRMTFNDCDVDGKYNVEITLGGQTETPKVIVSSLAVTGTPSAPTLTSSAETPVPSASRVTLTCTHSDPCIRTYEWQKDNVAIPDKASKTMAVSDFDASKEGVYSCKAVNHDAVKTRSGRSNTKKLFLTEAAMATHGAGGDSAAATVVASVGTLVVAAVAWMLL